MDQQRTSLGLGALLVVALGGVWFATRPTPPRAVAATGSASASAAGAASAAPSAAASAESDAEAGIDEALTTAPEPDGGSLLPAGAPKQVSFGVILFVYDGAQAAPKGSRTKAEALTLARASVADAKQDFAEAVKKGDRGSMKDAGRVPRGILEQPIELALFTLEKGQISEEPIDTPRGYWVVKRIE